jgi:mRNA interferase MazF
VAPQQLLRRGEVWNVDLDPVRGHEQGRRRPCAIVSANAFNRGRHGLVTVCPLTRTEFRTPLHVELPAGEAGLRARSFVLCEQIRTISTDRLVSRLGSLRLSTMTNIDDRLRMVLDL